MVTQDLKNTVDILSPEDRASLASYILHGLEAPVYDVSDQIVMERLMDLQSGEIQEIDHKTLLAGIHRPDFA